MALLKSCKTFHAFEPNSDKDLISNLPDIVIDNILKRLPIKLVAKMSTLSSKWRNIWLSLKYLVFDKHFWNELGDDEEKRINRCNCIISNILFDHVGPVYEFFLYAIYTKDELCVRGWVSLLSKVGVKKITIWNLSLDRYVPFPSSLFCCKDLVKLSIAGFHMFCCPSFFKGFASLQSLELCHICLKPDVFRSLIANCPRLRHLTVLQPHDWVSTQYILFINAPNLEKLAVEGDCGVVFIKNCQRLRILHLYMEPIDTEIVKIYLSTIKMLARSSQLQKLYLGGRVCKYLGADCISTLPPLKYLQHLHLTKVDLSDFDEFCFTLGMIRCCPFIKDLYILAKSEKCEVEHDFCYDKNYELINLVKVEMASVKGSNPELKLIEYLLSIASKLEKMAIKCSGDLDPVSKLKVAQNLLEMPRASTKAKVVCL